jgi:DNA-binding MarR family transcriptional regulator
MNDVMQMATGLSRLGTVMRSARWRQADALKLSPIQADMLKYLLSRGPVRQSVLAAELSVTQPTVSDAEAALRRKGLIEARPHPMDGRARLLHLTEAGSVAATDVSGWPAGLLDAIAAVDPADRAAMMRGLVSIVGHLQQTGAIAPQRMCTGCAHFRPNTYPGASKPHHCAFVNAAFGDAELRVDCSDFHEAGSASMR